VLVCIECIFMSIFKCACVCVLHLYIYVYLYVCVSAHYTICVVITLMCVYTLEVMHGEMYMHVHVCNNSVVCMYCESITANVIHDNAI